MVLAAVWKMDYRRSTCGGYCSDLGKGWRKADKFGEYFRRLANGINVGQEGWCGKR